MKRIFLFLAIFSVSLSAFAQENGNRDENGRIVRGPYETNGIWDNWSIGVAGGVNLIGHKFVRPLAGVDAEINVSKWLTPCYGLRVGIQGITGRGSASMPLEDFFYTEKDGRYVNTLGFVYAHGDFLWNLTNGIWGYRESRVYDCVPYIHTGYMVTGFKGDDGGIKWPRELALGGGVLNIFNVTKRLDVTLDVRGIVYNGRALGTENPAYDVTIAVGLNVNLGKTNWKRSAGVTPEQWKKANDAIDDANKALDNAKAEIADRDKALAAKDSELAKARADAEAARREAAGKTGVLSDIAPATMYFKIDESEFPVKELLHFDYYVKTVLANVDENRTIVITGTADKNTGSAARNRRLAEKRAKYVRSLLIDKYNVAPERIVTKSDVVKADKAGEAQLYRAVVIAL